MATTTTRSKAATKANEQQPLLTAIATFLERIDTLSRRTLTEAVEAYEDVAAELRPVYDTKNVAYRAAQTSTTEDKRTDLPISKFHTQLAENLGEAFKMKEPALRAVVDFWKLHSAEAFAGYNDKCATDQRMGSWTGYVAFLRDVKNGYVGTDGAETGTRPKGGKATSTDAGVQLTTVDYVAEIDAPNTVERMIAAQKMLHDLQWQVAEGMAKLSPEQAKAVRAAVKLAKESAAS